MNSWPPIQPPDWDYPEEIYKPQRKTEFQANYTQVAPAATRARLKFPLKWEMMSETDYQTLVAFFLANQGAAFTYTRPILSTSHTCVFSGDTLKGTPHSVGWRKNVECPIEEM